jgi:hypothetical protein
MYLDGWRTLRHLRFGATVHIIVEARCIEQNNCCLVKQIALIAVSNLSYPVSSLAGGCRNSGRKGNLKYRDKIEMQLSAVILARMAGT